MISEQHEHVIENVKDTTFFDEVLTLNLAIDESIQSTISALNFPQNFKFGDVQSSIDKLIAGVSQKTILFVALLFDTDSESVIDLQTFPIIIMVATRIQALINVHPLDTELTPELVHKYRVSLTVHPILFLILTVPLIYKKKDPFYSYIREHDGYISSQAFKDLLTSLDCTMDAIEKALQVMPFSETNDTATFLDLISTIPYIHN